MKTFGVWAASAFLGAIIAIPLTYFGLATLWVSKDRSHDFGLLLYLLLIIPILATCHAIPYAILKEKSKSMPIQILIPALVAGPACAISVFLVAKAGGYN